MKNNLTGSDRVKLILRYFFERKIDVLEFCKEFETQYNLNTDQSELTMDERAAYDELLRVTSWYSPFPDERRKIPNYVDEKSVEAAARVAAERLELR